MRAFSITILAALSLLPSPILGNPIAQLTEGTNIRMSAIIETVTILSVNYFRAIIESSDILQSFRWHIYHEQL